MIEVNGSRGKKIDHRELVSFPLVAFVAFAVTVGCAAARVSAGPTAMFPSGATFRLEIAADPEAHRVGYMYREHVAADEGMLFIFESAQPYPFWMKNCRVNLDIIWLDDDYRVVEIAHDRPPCPAEGECPEIFPMRSASYVLEVAGGTARREKLERGDTIDVHLAPSQER